jgi:hypothetical protein
MNQQEEAGLADTDGNCRQCGHESGSHLVIAYDVNDFSKGGEVRCPQAGCNCFYSLDFNFKTAS